MCVCLYRRYIYCESAISKQVIGSTTRSIAGVFPRIPLLDADQGPRMTLKKCVLFLRSRNRRNHGTIEPWRGRKFEITRLAEFLIFSSM